MSVLLKWFNYIEENNTKKKDIEIDIDNINNIKALTQQKENLKKEMQAIQEKRDRCLRNYEYIKKRNQKGT